MRQCLHTTGNSVYWSLFLISNDLLEIRYFKTTPTGDWNKETSTVCNNQGLCPIVTKYFVAFTIFPYKNVGSRSDSMIK